MRKVCFVLVIVFTLAAHGTTAQNREAFIEKTERSLSVASLSAPPGFGDQIEKSFARVGVTLSREWKSLPESNVRVIFLKNVSDAVYLGPLENGAFRALGNISPETRILRVDGNLQYEGEAFLAMLVFVFADRFSLPSSDLSCSIAVAVGNYVIGQPANLNPDGTSDLC